MPLDKAGSYHANPAVARMHDAHAKPEGQQPDPGAQEDEHGHPEIHHIELHPHGDGKLHSITHYHEGHEKHTPEGERADHESLDHAHEHLKGVLGEGAEHEPDGDEGMGGDVDDEY